MCSLFLFLSLSFSPISQGHITVYSYNGDILYQLTGTGGVVLSRGSSERLPSFLMTAVSGMCFASNPADSASTLLIATSYDGQITTYSLRYGREGGREEQEGGREGKEESDGGERKEGGREGREESEGGKRERGREEEYGDGINCNRRNV